MAGRELATHADAGHWPWEQIGGSVYCSCGAKLYQGRVPVDQEAARALVYHLDRLVLAAGGNRRPWGSRRLTERLAR